MSKNNPYKRKPSADPPAKLMRQIKPKGGGTLHDFFGGADHSAPPFFLLDFAHRRAVFLRQLPANTFVLKSTIKWQGKQLQLCSTEPIQSSEKAQQLLPPPSYPLHAVSLLKSHLQVSVLKGQEATKKGHLSTTTLC
eukprot:m.117517 g.117517  ORF g.117517 m.117517 type:complete len:137 (-) comp15429_c0_seq3:898-1308(-)